MVVLDSSKNIIKELSITKLKSDSSYVCSLTYLKLPEADGLKEIKLNNENKGYKTYNLSFDKKSCMIERGFVYKIKGYALGSVDSIIIKY